MIHDQIYSTKLQILALGQDTDSSNPCWTRDLYSEHWTTTNVEVSTKKASNALLPVLGSVTVTLDLDVVNEAGPGHDW